MEEKLMVARMNEGGSYPCLTQHPGYQSITENIYVLEVVYIDFRTENEPLELPLHKYVMLVKVDIV